MIGLVPLAAALAITAGQFDLAAVASAETRAGETPLAADQPPQNTLMVIAIPGVEVLYKGRRLSLDADYRLRIAWRTVEGEPVPGPLFLHTVALSLKWHATSRLTTTLAASAYEGSADYTFLPVIYGTTQAALVTVPRLFSATINGRAELRATRLVTPSISLDATHNQPIGPAQTVAGTPNMPMTNYTLPHFTSARANPEIALRLSRVTEASLSTLVMYEYVSGLYQTTAATTANGYATNTISVGVVVPTVGTEVRLAPLTNLKLKLGVAFTHFFTDVRSPDSVTPDGSVVIDARLFGHRDTALDLVGGAGVEYYVDPVLAIAAPRGAATATTLLRFAGDWSIGLQGTFSSTLSAHPLVSPAGLTYPDEVTAAAALPVRHQLSDYTALEFGVRWSDRSSFYSTPTFGFHQRQLWAYVMITGSTRSARLAPVVVP